MFWPDIIELSQFYHSPLGMIAKRRIRAAMQEFWPDVTQQEILGIGFATPYLSHFSHENNRIMALMPAAQGVMHWPEHGANASFIADESEIPLPDNFIDRVVLIHALEYTEQAQALMHEIWRILAPGGKILIIVPNRRGMWARIDGTPFAYGQPFSTGQLIRLLRHTMFVPLESRTTLFVPVSTSRMVLRTESICETIGKHFLPPFGGVLMMEAEKQIYAVNCERAPRAKQKRIYITAPNPIVPFSKK